MKRFQSFLREQEEIGPFSGEFAPDIEPEVEEIPSREDAQIPPALLNKISKLSDKESKSGSSLDEHIKSLVEFQVQVKAMHWATESFAQHKATCDIYAGLDAAMDALVESYQGYVGRIRIGGTYTILNYEDINIDPWLNSAMDHVNALRSGIEYSDVLNLLDEILALITKFKYLLTLK